ncbi:MAG TPA: 1-(5-phosphoribosyl)-5-[(5-phosphoribosylamino)methylideneamino]imidazole-4-carboxamide isomerase [Chloroflexota bacterium]
MVPFEVIPAIDVRRGKCVRLYQGDYARETVYDDDPVAVATRWAEQGAPRLHLVDLDGALDGTPRILPLLRRIVAAVPVPVQIGGGLRSLESVTAVLEAGADRAIIGTAAVENPALVAELVDRFGPRVVVALDARDGRVAVRGWREGTDVAAVDLARQMEQLGVQCLVVTDIARDGTLTAPNYRTLEEVLTATRLRVVASGGVSAVDHLLHVRALGASGAIVGRALYTGHLRLPEALAALAAASHGTPVRNAAGRRSPDAQARAQADRKEEREGAEPC